MAENEKLYGEIEPGVFEFRRGFTNYNPFAKHHWARYFLVRMMNAEQVRGIHHREIVIGRYLVPGEIREVAGLPEGMVATPGQRKAIEDWLVDNMIDEMDRRCEEASECAAQPWYQTHPHLARTLGMLHSSDWLALRHKIPEAEPKPPAAAKEVAAVEMGLIE